MLDRRDSAMTSNQMNLPLAKALVGSGSIDGFRLPLTEFIEAQQAEIERLTAEKEHYAAEWGKVVQHLTEHDNEVERLRAALDLSRRLPITTPELIRLRNAGQITFDKQVFAIIDFLLEQRECLAGETRTQSEGPVQIGGTHDKAWPVPSGWRGKDPWFKVGELVRPKTPFAGQRPLCTITEILPNGFKYTHAPIPTGSPHWGEYRGGETYEPSDYEFNQEGQSK
jgi:hypothetical protein